MAHEINRTRTGRTLYEAIEVSENGLSVEDAKFGLMSRQSDENLCDLANTNECEGDTYYTDDQWAITYWCDHHLKQQIKDGIFVEVENS